MAVACFHSLPAELCNRRAAYLHSSGFAPLMIPEGERASEQATNPCSQDSGKMRRRSQDTETGFVQNQRLSDSASSRRMRSVSIRIIALRFSIFVCFCVIGKMRLSA